MHFKPPRCPNACCPHHATPAPDFCVRNGHYLPRCRTRPVQRFRCRACRCSFSSQTFRHDCGDRRPECNEPLFQLLTSGVGLRQSGRVLKLAISSVQRKMRKLARTCELLHQNLCRRLPAGRTFLLDEEESYETASIRPLTIPVVIDKETWFVVATSVGPIRRLAPIGTERRERQHREEATRGPRPDRSKACVTSVLRRLAELVPSGPLLLRTDKKGTYRVLIRRIFGDRAAHEVTLGRAPRTTRNPLFPINVTMAMTRDNNGRLRQKSWLVSKVGEFLQKQLHLFAVYRNYVRQRFNSDVPGVTSALLLGLLPRAMTPGEVVRWRQDWRASSIHPMSLRGERTVGEMAAGVS